MRVSALVLPIVLLVACGGPKTFARPTGAGVPAPEAVEAWTQATAACSGVESDAPILTLAGGRVDGKGIPSLRILGALTRDGGIRLVASRGPKTVFDLVGRAERAQFSLQIDSPTRVVMAPAAEIVEALIGFDLGPVELLRVLTGCVGAGAAALAPRRFDDRMALTAGDRTVYLEQRDAVWRVAGADLPGLQIDYPEHGEAWPSEIVVATVPEGRASLRLRVQEHQINSPDLRPAAFEIRAIPGAEPMTLDELRQVFRR